MSNQTDNLESKTFREFLSILNIKAHYQLGQLIIDLISDRTTEDFLEVDGYYLHELVHSLVSKSQELPVNTPYDLENNYLLAFFDYALVHLDLNIPVFKNNILYVLDELRNYFPDKNYYISYNNLLVLFSLVPKTTTTSTTCTESNLNLDETDFYDDWIELIEEEDINEDEDEDEDDFWGFVLEDE